MNVLRSGLAVAAVTSLTGIALAQTLPVQRYPFKSGPVTITACSVGQNGNLVANNSLDIKYFQNESSHHLTSVTFRIRYAGKTATVTNNGNFTYQAPIEVKSNQLAGAPFSGAEPQVCRVLTATFDDGKTVTPAYERMGGRGMRPSPGESAMPEMPAAPESSPDEMSPMQSPAPMVSPSP